MKKRNHVMNMLYLPALVLVLMFVLYPLIRSIYISFQNWNGYSPKTTFIGFKKFQDISADQLQPGDIGLKSKTGGIGGANHVGIFCGKMKDGRVVWLHCTSSSGSSLTGNTEGPMFGVYTNFTYFRRLKKWNKK